MKNRSRKLSSLLLAALLAGSIPCAEAGVVDAIAKAVAKRAGAARKGASEVARKVKPTKKPSKAAQARQSRRAEKVRDLVDSAQSRQSSAECNQGNGSKRGGSGNC